MRARTDQLLNLPEQLRGLPDEPGIERGWEAVQARLRARQRRAARLGTLSKFAVAASVATLALIGAVRFTGDRAGTTSVATVATPVDAARTSSVRELRLRSQALDAALAALPARPAVSRAATALPIDAFEAQVQWLDHQLSLQATGAVAPRDAEKLWRERVEVMSSLVQLRYVEAQSVVM